MGHGYGLGLVIILIGLPLLAGLISLGLSVLIATKFPQYKKGIAGIGLLNILASANFYGEISLLFWFFGMVGFGLMAYGLFDTNPRRMAMFGGIGILLIAGMSFGSGYQQNTVSWSMTVDVVDRNQGEISLRENNCGFDSVLESEVIDSAVADGEVTLEGQGTESADNVMICYQNNQQTYQPNGVGGLQDVESGQVITLYEDPAVAGSSTVDVEIISLQKPPRIFSVLSTLGH